MLAQVLLNCEVVVAGSQCPEIVEACHLIAASSLDEAIEQAKAAPGRGYSGHEVRSRLGQWTSR
jgi:hypothetical protein